MKKVIILALILFGAYQGWHRWQDKAGSTVAVTETRGDAVVVSQGKAKLTGTQSEPYEIDLRVFGYNRNTLRGNHQVGPLAFVTHLLVAQPLGNHRAAFQKEMCERSSAQSAPTLLVVAASRDAHATLDRLAGSGDREYDCVRVGGHTLHWTDYSYDGHSGFRGWESFASFTPDPHKIVNVERVRPISCSGA